MPSTSTTAESSTMTTPSTPPTRGHFKRWRVAPRVEESAGLAKSLRVDPLVGQLLWRRGMRDVAAARAFIDPKLTDLHDPAQLPGCARAADRLINAVREKQPVVIYGDYDVDGVTATAILFHTLKAADPDADVRRYVPHRVEEGYGLNSDAIRSCAELGAKVVVSVDCGITACEQGDVAREVGVDLIITDHHEMRSDGKLPDAHTLVHPRLPEGPHNPDGLAYPFGEICGAGVAYKLAWQFARTWCGSDRVTGVFKKLLVDLLSFAGLGTIADVVPLVDENRTIASFGLRRIKQTPFAGLNALVDAARLRDENIDAYHVGFVLGPRLNACGRMGHAKRAIKLLTDADMRESRKLAEFLDQENRRRRDTERAIFEQAKQMVIDNKYDHDDVRAIVLGHADWHVGVVGIVCSRLVEAFGRPTILVNTANGQASGSARSIDGFNLHAAIDACSEHLDRFGGHAMAAGLKLPTEKLDAFRDAMIDYARAHLTVEDLTPVLEIDAEVELTELRPTAVEQIERLAPFGRANPGPVLLVRDARITQPPQTLGREARHLALFIEQNGTIVRCIGWNMGKLADRLAAGDTLDVVAKPKLNHWNGRTNTELVIEDLNWSA